MDSISFASLGDDSTTEILVCYSMLNQSEKTLSVLNYSDGLISELYSGSYSCMEVIDLNGDGQQELVSVVPGYADLYGGDVHKAGGYVPEAQRDAAQRYCGGVRQRFKGNARRGRHRAFP